MKNKIATCILLLSISTSWSQITFTKDFMPNVGDTVYYRNVPQVTQDFLYTGANANWDFSAITGLTWAADTFVAVLSTPLTYNAVFNNPILYPAYKATVASPQADQTIPPSTSITNVFFYFKETDTAYAQVGLAANVSGAPLPVRFDDIDYIYKFPSTMGSIDSCYSSYHIDIPTLGFYSKKQHRVNEYDGWGTLYTPMDTFEVFRIKTTIVSRDSVFITQYNMPFATNSTIIEYKWFSPGYRNPVYIATNTISQFANGTTVKYLDYPQLHIGINELSAQKHLLSPNPCLNEFSIVANKENRITTIKLYLISGAAIFPKQTVIDDSHINVDMSNLPSGAYIVEIYTNNGIERQIMLKQ